MRRYGHLTHRAQPSGADAGLKPSTRPPGRRRALELFQPRQGHQSAALGQDRRLPKFSFQECRVRLAVAADAVLASSERPATLKHVEVFGVEIQAGGEVLVTLGTGTVRVGLEMRARPLPHPGGHGGLQDEFELGGEGPDVPRVAHMEGGYGPHDHLDTRKLHRHGNVTTLPRIWHGRGASLTGLGIRDPGTRTAGTETALGMELAGLKA